MAIGSRFAWEAKILETSTEARDEDIGNDEGWLIPGYKQLQDQEHECWSWVNEPELWWQQCEEETCDNYGYFGKCKGTFRCQTATHERRRIEKRSQYSLLGTHWTNESIGPSTLDNNWMHFGVPGPHFLHLLENVHFELSTPLCNDIQASFRFKDHQFQDFMNTFKVKLIRVEDRKVVRVDEGSP
jgi:hypothetical protein